MNTRSNLLALSLLAAVFFGIAGCRAPAPSAIPDRPTSVVSETLVPGDVLKITFLGNRDFDQVQRIRPDGKIGLPTVGEVRAAGKTLGRLQAELSSLYKKQLQISEVLVNLEGSASVVYVTGAVGKPGKVLLDRPMTAFEAILESGGFAPGLANPKKVLLIRNENGKQQTRVLDLSPTVKGRTSTAFYLKPYDSLQVQERFF